MENSLENLDKEQPQREEKEDEASKIISYTNRNLYVTRSVRLTIKFPLRIDDNDDDSPFESEDEVKEEIKKEEAGSPGLHDPVSGDQTGLEDHTGGVQRNDLLFYGVVRDHSNKALDGAAVMVFAVYRDGIEKPLGHSFTNTEGAYIINIPAPPDYSGLEGYTVRAGKGSPPTEEKSPPVKNRERPGIIPSNRNFHDFLKFVSNSPNKTISELIKGFQE